MKRKILLIDTVHRIIPDKLIACGYEVVQGFELSKKDILACIHDFYGIVLRSRIDVDKEFIDKAAKLRFVARVGAGMESIDLNYCKDKGIICLNSPEGNRDAVGEHATGMLLNLLNNLNKADREVKQGIWKREDNRGSELNTKTVGIIGYGNMGSSFAKKLSGFGCKVISYDKYKTGYTDGFTIETDLNTIFTEADILSLHVPLTEETKYMINDEFLSSFKKKIIIINTARGPVVETSALVRGLKSGKIISAALDVIEFEETSFETTSAMTENKDFQYLVSCENVILSPHIAGWTHESRIKLAEILVNKIIGLKL